MPTHTSSLPSIELYTDGACRGNPGPGGWGALLRYHDPLNPSLLLHEKILSGGTLQTTNNRMELQAVIEGLKNIKKPCIVHVYTDSQYVQKGMTEWLFSWKKKAWKTAAGHAVKNEDLWKTLDLLCQNAPYRLEWHWVKGHAGHPCNERVDTIARAAIP